jgi:hypothetical protein
MIVVREGPPAFSGQSKSHVLKLAFGSIAATREILVVIPPLLAEHVNLRSPCYMLWDGAEKELVKL